MDYPELPLAQPPAPATAVALVDGTESDRRANCGAGVPDLTELAKSLTLSALGVA